MSRGLGDVYKRQAQIGQKMLDDRLGVITEYGLIRRKDGQPLPVFQPEQEIGQGLEMM